MMSEFQLPMWTGLRLLLNPFGLWIWWNAPKRCSFRKYAKSCFCPAVEFRLWRGSQ